MTKILHLSDMHFGTHQNETIEVLAAAIIEVNPDVIAISGDFTQRARHKQFALAQMFLKKLANFNIVCVPGNHDITFDNLLERFFWPFDKYQHYISTELNPFYENQSLAILGINSATPFRRMNGIVNGTQLSLIETFFADRPKASTKMIILHHNLIQTSFHKVIENAEELINTLINSKVNIVLSGHLHDACVEKIQTNTENLPLYIITAGTATSSRLRSQANSFNVIAVTDNQFELSVHELQHDRYVALPGQIYDLRK